MDDSTGSDGPGSGAMFRLGRCQLGDPALRLIVRALRAADALGHVGQAGGLRVEAQRPFIGLRRARQIVGLLRHP